jgi:tRNA threonylcarbamoyladenosine biosynthesis protein TsaB
MNVLGIETATSVCGVGIAGEDGFIADYRLQRGLIHAEHLTEAVHFTLKSAGFTPNQLNGIAISIGPGSFTGLRIGLAMAKGMAFALNIPVLAVPTMDALIHQIPPLYEWACVMLVARKIEVYQGCYQFQSESWKMMDKPKVMLVDQLGIGFNKPTLFIGEGAIRFRNEIEVKVKHCHFISSLYSQPSGFKIAMLGRSLLISGQTADIDTLVPQYIKRFKGIA